MYSDYHLGQTSIVLRPKIRRLDTSQGFTGLSSSSPGLVVSTIADNEPTPLVYTQAGGTIESIGTLGIYGAPTATKCRFRQVDATNHPGLYELQIADARFAVAGAKSLTITLSGVTNMAEVDILIPLRAVDPYDGAAFGLSRLDTNVGSRMATYAQPSGFLAATFPPAVAAVGSPMTVSDKTGFKLANDGMDLVIVEAGVNARQALSPILAAAAGTIAGAGTGTVVINGGNVATARIQATTDLNGNRIGVTLNLPA